MNHIFNMDCLEGLKTLAENSVDSIVTDPPYELGFMGKAWDNTGIAYNVGMWKEALRVLKPGGHLLSFGGSRTYHRMACAIEDAGFEIRDMIEWVYGSGFPKSLDVSKAIDKQAGTYVRGETSPNSRQSGESPSGCYSEGVQTKTLPNPQSDSAKQWQGFGTSLKPAHEPICMARKPLSESTVAANVLRWGTGAINIDGSRIEMQKDDRGAYEEKRKSFGKTKTNRGENVTFNTNPILSPEELIANSVKGRFPANLLHDGSEEVLEVFPKSAGAFAPVRRGHDGKSHGIYGDFAQKGDDGASYRGDTGSAARFFYCAKASQAERNAGCEEVVSRKSADYRPNDDGTKGIQSRLHGAAGVSGNNHPTVKPQGLMRYLIKLVTPTDGIVCDPFTGSGSTLVAAVAMGYSYIGFELNPDYIKIAQARIESEEEKKGLFRDGLDIDAGR